MSALQQAVEDQQMAKGYVDLFEQRAGKKCSDRMRRWLQDAVMAGIKHGRETAGGAREREISEMLADMKRRGGFR